MNSKFNNLQNTKARGKKTVKPRYTLDIELKHRAKYTNNGTKSK